MKSVVCRITCQKCPAEVVEDRDRLPSGWWVDDQGREVCPRHQPIVTSVDRLADDDREAATVEHFLRGFDFRSRNELEAEERARLENAEAQAAFVARQAVKAEQRAARRAVKDGLRGRSP